MPLLVGDLQLELVVVIWRPYYQLLCTDHLITERGGCRDFSGGEAVNYCLNFSLSPSLSNTNIGLLLWMHGHLPHLSIDNICVSKLLLSIDIKNKMHCTWTPFFSSVMKWLVPYKFYATIIIPIILGTNF